MMTFTEVWCSVSDIDGWLTEGQARMLYDAATQVPQGESIVEIGSHHGRSTIILGSGKSHDVQLVAVDPYGDARWGGGEDILGVFQANLAAHDLQDQVVLIRELGSQAGHEWDGSAVGLLFVDGAHDYASVSSDLTAWLPHLSDTATVIMHDAYSSLGVTRAAFVRMFGSRDFRYRGSSRSLVCFRRQEGFRVVSCVRMLGKLPWLARNLAVKTARRQGWSAVERLLGHTDTALPY